MNARTVFFSIFSILTVSAESAVADPSQLAPQVFDGRHDSEYGKFTHWSAVIQKDEGRLTVEYAVCNFEHRSLNYKWKGPNITVGDGGSLPSGKCHIVNRDVASIEHDRKAVILFTQAGRNHPASAHISKLSVPTGFLPSFLVNQLRTFFGPEGTTAQPSLADLFIVQARSDGSVRHTISWNPPSVTVAFAIDFFGGQSADVVSRAMSGAGYKAEVTTLQAALAESSQTAIPKERLAKEAILVRKIGPSVKSLTFTIEAKTGSVGVSHVTLIDAETKKLGIDVEISSFSP